MPGKRCLAREYAQHDAAQRMAECYALLRAQLPDHDRALVGARAVLEYLAALGIRRPNGGPVTWRMVLRWHRTLGLPLVRGGWHPHRPKQPCLTTAHVITSWCLAQFDTMHRRMTFGVSRPSGLVPGGRRPNDRDMRKWAKASQREIAA